MTHEEKISYLSVFMEEDALEFITSILNGFTMEGQRFNTKILCEAIKLLSESFTKNDNPASLSRNLIFIRAFYCQRHTFATAVRKYALLKNLVRALVKHGFLVVDGTLPLEPKSAIEYKKYKKILIPKETIDKISIIPSAESIFNETLDICCPPQIAKRLKEHVKSFKHQKHHRFPIVQFLIQVSKTSPDWPKHPKILQGELLKYRNNLLDHYQRNTAYNIFQNLKNAFSVLIEHQLLPNNIELPGNLRRCENTQKIRLDNPVISDINIYDEEKKQIFIGSQTFINNYKKDISENLNLLVTAAQNIVYAAYQRFLSKNDIVENSQVAEFIHHPRLLVKNTRQGPGKKTELNPFYDTHPLFFENRLAALDHFFDLISNNIPLPDVNFLSSGNNELLGYLGLTPIVASAMQIVIVEELGINPYSLYKIKISSDGHGHEFVQVSDEGGVRLKALKSRARKVRENHANGTNIDLSKVDAHEINAATCLKMALEMTSRTRKSVNRQELWICLSKHGATAPSPETFQKHFNIIAEQASASKSVLNNATLKKIRTSKAVLIFLESNGDSLKAALYLGNKVKTTLSYYIPIYIRELVYRKKIRAFQNILLFMAVANDESPSLSLNLSNKDFEEQVKQAFSNPDMGGNFYKRLVNGNIQQEFADIKYFCLSERNIKLAIQYAKTGPDLELKNDCETVLAKISEGPIILKQLLRKAHISLQNSK